MFIYKITNIINGKFYVGKTTNSIITRFNQHCSSKNKMVIARAIQKYGKENFIVEELYKCASYEELNIQEQRFIYELSPKYNCSKGGDGGALFSGCKHSEYSRQLMATARTGKKDSIETKHKKSESRKKYKHSKETIEKYSNSQAKEYLFVNPDNKLILIRNLNKFSRENELVAASMRALHTGKIYRHRGYKRAIWA